MDTLDYLDLSDETFNKLTILLFKNSGITLKEHKKYLVLHRLSKLVGPNKHFKNFETYYDALLHDKNGGLMEKFVNMLTTNWSFFFRESVHFDFLKEYLKEQADKQEYIRLWSAACSSGEEPYSMAISILQTFQNITDLNIKILATDISTKVLNLAKKGRYHYSKVRGHIKNKELRVFFDFDKDNNDFIVKQKVKDLTAFRYLNLMENYPFNKKFDVVFLRNVLIYFDISEKEFIINKVCEYLKPNGLLIVGMSEGLVGLRHSLQSVRSSVYRKSK